MQTHINIQVKRYPADSGKILAGISRYGESSDIKPIVCEFWALWNIMHECVTTSTCSTRAKPEGCMYLWLRTFMIIVVQYKVSADSV